uniref:Uncharacterized protein n=1 Tax=Oryza brachyantha TaxID=4533 RepID=J3KU64_ORYBR
MKAELCYLGPVLKAVLLRRLKGGGLGERVKATTSLSPDGSVGSASGSKASHLAAGSSVEVSAPLLTTGEARLGG